MLSAGSNEIIDNEEAQIEILLQELADPAKYSNGTEVRLLEFLNPGVARPQKSTRVSRESASPDHICKGLSSTLRSRLALRAVKTVTEALAGYSIRGNRSSNRSGLGTDAICGAAGGNSAIGERDDSPPNAAATHGHDLWIRTLAKCGLQSLEFIGSPPGLMNIAKFDREKAACNIAMRLIDLGYSQLSLDFVEYIYSRLWSRGGNDPNGDIDSSEKSELASKKEILSNCARNCKLDTITRRALGLITLPKGASGEFNGDRILIGIICVSMALRVILADPQFENPESLARGVRHPHLGIESLFKKLDAIKSLEEEKKKYSRYMFKLFYTAYTGRSKNISLTLPLRSLSLYFFCKSSLYTFPLYQGIIQSAIKTYENNSSADIYHRDILSFYSSALDCFDLGIPTSPVELSCKWIKNCLDICLEKNDTCLKTRTSQILLTFFSSPFQVEALINVSLQAILAAIKNVDIFLCLTYAKDTDISDIQEDTVLSLKLLSSNKRNFVFGDNCEDLKSLFKSLYFHRELAPELLRHGAMEASGVVILDIVFDILTGYFERSNRSSKYRSALVSEVISYAVMVSEWRAILSKKEGIPDHSLPAIKILSYALNVFEEHKCIKYLFPIANAIYVIARSVYMTGKGAEITDLLRRLIPVMEEEILTAQDIEMDNITLAIKVADIYIYYLMKSREYERASCCIVDCALLLMKEKFKYKNSKCIIRLLRRLVEKSIKIQNFHNRDPLVSLIRTAASDLPIEDIFVIGELEIYCLKALSFSGCNGLELIVRLVDGLLPLVKKEVAPITYARMLLEKAFALRCLGPKKRGSIMSDIPNSSTWCCDEILKTIEHMENGKICKDGDIVGKLIGYDISCIRAEAYILKGITENEHGDYNGTPFISALSLWVERMDYFSSSIEPSGREGIYEIYSPEKAAYAHLKSIADYFEMLDLQHHKIICVRLLIKFIPLCRLGEEKEVNSIICLAYIELCFSYLKLRLTEEAEAALEQAYNLMKGKEHYQIVSTNYIATYAYYLACFGHTSKAKQYISVAVKQAFSEPAQDDIYIPDWMAYSGKYLQSYVFLCSAAISLLSGDVVTAVQSAEASFELLVKAFMHTLPDVCSSFISIKTPAASQEQKPDNQKARSISKNGNSLSLSRMGNSLAELNLWSYAGKLMNVYNMLGMSYTYRGSSEEADYYYEQGLEIAQLNSSKVLQCHFHANIADVSSRRNLPEKSSKNLEGCYKSLKRIANSSEVPLIHLVHLKFCTGNYRFRNNDVDTAIGLYKEAELHIRKCTTKIDGTFLEIVLPKALSLTKDLLLDKQYKTADQTMLKSVHKDDPTDTMFYLFQCLMVEIATRVSMALMKKSSVSDAEAALISVESLRHRQIEQSEYYGALTKLKMLKVVQQLKQHTNHSAFFDSVFSLPLICATSGCETSRLDNPTRKKAGDRANSISSILSFFKKAFHLAYLYGPSIQIHEIAHSISYLCVMEAYLPGHTSLGATIELASLSTLYLDISKGYTTKKEFVCTTKDKFGASEERTADSDCITSHNHTHTPGAEGGLAARGAWRDLYNYYMCEDTADPIVYETAQKLLPDDWIIFSISIDTERADLYISRYSRSEKLMLRLPISRKSVRSDTRQEFPDLDKVSSTFGELLRENREVMGYAGSCVTPELKADWWKKRKVINDKLRNLIDTVEEEWFGAFRGIFSMDKLSYAEFDGHIEVFKAGLEQLISTHIEFKDMTLDDSASRGYIDTKLCKIILSLGPDVSYNDLEDIIYFILSSYQYTGSNIDYSSLSLETISDTLVALIRDFYRSIRKVPSLHNPKHIILILDRNLQFFPWESMSTLRSLPSCRLPTLSFLRDHLLKLSISGESREVEETPYTSVDPSNCFYLLNPGNDLSTTQKTFKLYLESEKSWTGAVGNSFKEADIIETLEKKDLFIYFGHGGGEKYINGRIIRKLTKSPVALLLGCSSGSLQPQGEFDPSGTPLNYLMSGSRAILANLWDVTDRDIDRFSTEMFKEWGLGNTSLIEKQPGNIGAPKDNLYSRGSNISLSEAVMRSRNSCVLSYLTGAAPVVYGIPVYLNVKNGHL